MAAAAGGINFGSFVSTLSKGMQEAVLMKFASTLEQYFNIIKEKAPALAPKIEAASTAITAARALGGEGAVLQNFQSFIAENDRAGRIMDRDETVLTVDLPQVPLLDGIDLTEHWQSLSVADRRLLWKTLDELVQLANKYVDVQDSDKMSDELQKQFQAAQGAMGSNPLLAMLGGAAAGGGAGAAAAGVPQPPGLARTKSGAGPRTDKAMQQMMNNLSRKKKGF